MSNAAFVSKWVVVVAIALSASGCDDENKSGGAAPAASKPAHPAAPAPQPKASAPAPSAAPAVMRDDCPEGSSGEGTFNKPCAGTGTTRLMEVTWTGKMSDTGPSFRVVNKSKLPILYGKLAVYFYDKSGKQIDTKGKPKLCSGNIFDGPMKPGEKAVITFSCVKKDDVPEGATAIEGELETVGFTDASGKTNEFYWTNKDLAPAVRSKTKKKK